MRGRNPRRRVHTAVKRLLTLALIAGCADEPCAIDLSDFIAEHDAINCEFAHSFQSSGETELLGGQRVHDSGYVGSVYRTACTDLVPHPEDIGLVAGIGFECEGAQLEPVCISN